MKYFTLLSLLLLSMISDAQLPASGWSFSYPGDNFTNDALLDLRYLNEKTAG